MLGYNESSDEADVEINTSTHVAKFGVFNNMRLVVTGTKSRKVDTEDYGSRLLYCYETPSPMFGDIGEGVIGEDGLVYIFFDPKFSETIDTYQYQVFLQRYGEGDAVVIERNAHYFVVKGTPNLPFGWEVKGKQIDYKQVRLEDYNTIEPITLNEVNYGSLAATYLKELKEERRNENSN